MRPVSVLLLVSLSAAFVLISARSEPKPEPKCPKNQHWEDRGTACPKNCQNKDALIKCTADTVAGCFCDKGYVFQSGESGPCVLIKDCPKPPAPCPKNMTRELDCIPCPQYCDEKKNKFCTAMCTPPKECYCKRGYVYDNKNKCVLPKDCPKK
ncbi:mucin-6-like [Eleutherodactylus coqui]|uniref:TIL domain-containing protein n=1 Tax=Eleutherodactylus coqui TaxID=57060 RepID=A0A8J6E810_ELECQ|nr:hypothetical protein GDO78_022045 [Eleutherodactylus coqui]